MPDIRYVCLSDMHLGEEDSLLTNLKVDGSGVDPTQASPVLIGLVACLRDLVDHNQGPDKPTLILNGDILELALATDDQAFMCFERFIEQIMAPGREICGEIIYLPGNHDHHLWELARETQYVNYIKGIKAGAVLPAPWHTTSIFPKEGAEQLLSYSLTNLVRRYDHLASFPIKTAYPNFGLFQAKTRKCVVFHHGHYVESLYHLMTTLKDLLFPNRRHRENIWDIEAENFAWIDFFWSTMGRSGEVGQGVELIYEKLQDQKQFKQLLYSLADGLARAYDLPGWGDHMEAELAKWAFNAAVDKFYGTERTRVDRPLSEDARQGLEAYLNGPLREQLRTELSSNMPAALTFVFGHTHKPFQEEMTFPGYPVGVEVYNTGGWVVETVAPQPLHGGSVVLIDEDLTAVSLRMYNENGAPAGPAVSLQEVRHSEDAMNPFYIHLSSLISQTAGPWRDFPATAARAVRLRARNLRARIKEKA